MLKELIVSVVLPMMGMSLVIIWKQLLKQEVDNEDYLVILELLSAAVILTMAVSLNDTDRRSPAARDVAAVIAVIVGVGVVPVAARLVRSAYDPKQKHLFTREDVWWANGLGVEVFVLAYFFTHISS